MSEVLGLPRPKWRQRSLGCLVILIFITLVFVQLLRDGPVPVDDDLCAEPIFPDVQNGWSYLEAACKLINFEAGESARVTEIAGFDGYTETRWDPEFAASVLARHSPFFVKFEELLSLDFFHKPRASDGGARFPEHFKEIRNLLLLRACAAARRRDAPAAIDALLKVARMARNQVRGGDDLNDLLSALYTMDAAIHDLMEVLKRLELTEDELGPVQIKGAPDSAYTYFSDD